MGIELGLVGIGTAIMGSFGAGAAAFATTTLGTVVAGAIGGALVGAAIGGLTAAVMGGDIMKGVLFGAVGGAVTGGLGGYFQAGNAALSGQGMAVQGMDSAGYMTQHVVGNAGAVAEAGRTGIGAALQTTGTNLMKEYGGDIVKGVAGNIMKMKEMDKEQKIWLEQAKVKHDYDIAAAREKAKLTAKYGGGGGGGGGGGQEVPYMDIERIRQQTEREKLAEQRRQFNLQSGERKQARADLIGKEEDRQALFKGYQGRGAGAGEGGEGDTGIYQARQEDALAAVEGGQPLTGGGAVQTAVGSENLALALQDQDTMDAMVANGEAREEALAREPRPEEEEVR